MAERVRYRLFSELSRKEKEAFAEKAGFPKNGLEENRLFRLRIMPGAKGSFNPVRGGYGDCV